ncbi:predicted protein, partial [Naegleria gruberi]
EEEEKTTPTETKEEEEEVEVYKKKTSTGSRKGIRKAVAPLSSEEKKEKEIKARKESVEARKKRKVEKTVKKKHSVVEIENLWQGWKEVFLVGTEWNCYDLVYNVDWDFEHLHDFLFYDEDSATIRKQCFVFGCTEPQLIDNEMVYIPALVAVVSDLAPPTTIGIKSVQMVNEEIVDMKKLKMSWVPFIPREDKSQNIGQSNIPKVFALHCNLRRNLLSKMKEEDVRKYEYCLPYCFRPNRVVEEIKKDNEGAIELLYVLDKSGSVQFSFDPKEDDIDTIIEEVCEDNDLDADVYSAKLKTFIKDEVKKHKETVQKKVEAKEEEISKLSEEQRKSLNEMKVYKFYPKNTKPDLSSFKVAYVNRYYGKA